MRLAYIGLGSNLQEPLHQVQQAITELAQLPKTQFIAKSRFYKSQAIGPDQPDFVNAVVLIRTELEPIMLLDELQAIEQIHQRKREMHWGPRTLDLDILLYDNKTIQLPRLSVPHPFLTQRAFVLYPLLDITPELVLPDDNRKLSDFLVNCTDQIIQPLSLE